MDYLEVTIDLVPRNPWAEIAMVQLADQGFESFVDTETGLLAYAQVTAVDVLQCKHFDTPKNNSTTKLECNMGS
jgi:hypothetical protein